MTKSKLPVAGHTGLVGNLRTGKKRRISLTQRLLVAASVTAVTAALPGAFGVYGGRARAQAVPAGCTDGGNDIAENGETVTCLAPPSPIAGVSTNVDDITVNIGDGSTPTTVNNGGGSGVGMMGSGSQAVNIYNAGSSVTGSIYGVYAYGTAGVSDVTITNEGTITGTSDAIRTYVLGDGDITIDTNNTYGVAGDAVDAFASNGSISVTATGTVTGGNTGIRAANSGGVGTIDVTLGSSAVVTGQGGPGILATSSDATSNITVQGSSGYVVGATDGINLTTAGAVITVQNLNSVTGQAGDGIVLRSNGGAITVQNIDTINANGGSFDGIDAISGGGAILIDNVGSVGGVNASGIGGDGIYANSEGGTGGITISATGNIDGQSIGVKAYNDTGGSINITTSSVTSDDTAIFAEGDTGNVDVNITATGMLYSADGTVYGYNDGTGSTTISVADVVAANGDGVLGENGATTTGDLSITSSGTVQASGIGVSTSNSGSGDTIINVVNVYGDTDASTSGDGIDVTHNAVLNTVVDVTATGVVSGVKGIDVSASSNGDITVTTQGVIGTVAEGIDIINGGPLAGDITVNAQGPVVGQTRGIEVESDGVGAFSITASDVTGVTDDGIYARIESSSAGAMSITTIGTVTGAENGIYARQSGAGGLTINTVDVASTNGVGIESLNFGAGALSVTTADVTSNGSVGIFAYNSAVSAADVSVDSSAGSVNSDNYGILVRNFGSGDLSITTADVTSMTTGAGVFGGSFGGDLSIDTTAGTVTSAEDGVRGFNYLSSTGALSIAVGNVTGGDDGVLARNAGTDLTVTSTGLVTGGYQGIDALNEGTGALSITAADVTGLGDDAIDVVNSPYGTTLSVETTGIIDGVDDGIDATNFGTDLSITTAGSVTGGQSGIEAYNYGSGTTTITVGGAVTGTTELGIYTVTENGARITVASGGSVTGSMGAIHTDAASAPGDPSDDRVTLAAGGLIDGDVLLDAGADRFNDQGGSFTKVLGGDGIDTAIFNNAIHDVTGDGSNVNAIQEVEIFNFNSGITGLAGTHTDVTMSTIAAGATLNARDGASLSGLLTNNGILNIGNSPGVFTVTGDFVQGADGSLPIEIDSTGFDQLVVTGDATLGGELNVIILGGVTASSTTRTIIDAGTGITGTFDTINNGLLIANSVDIDTTNFDVNLTTTVNNASTIPGLNDNQQNTGDGLINGLSGGGISSDAIALINAVGSINDVATLGSTLDDLGPEALDMGLKSLTIAQGRFIDLVLSLTSTSSPAEPVRTASLNGGPVSYAANDGGPRAWGAIDVYAVEQNGGAEHIDFDGRTFSFAAGISGINLGGFSIGFAGGVSSFDGDSDGLRPDNVDTEMFHIAGTASANGNLFGLDGRFDTILGYAQGDNQLVMKQVDPVTNNAISQRGDADMSSIDWAARYSVLGSNGDDWYVKPYVQAGVNIYSQDAVNIGSNSVTALQIEELDNTRWHVGLGATFEHRLSDHVSLDGRAVGKQYFGDTDNVFASRFAFAPMGSPAFDIAGKEIERQVELDASLKFHHGSGFVLSVGAFGEVGDINLYGGNVRLSKHF